MYKGILLFAVFLVASMGSSYRQDAANGKKIFRKCAACHAVGEKARNKIDPQLNGVIGREAGNVEGFKYSKGILESGLIRDETTLTEYLRNPKSVGKTTRMAFPGLNKDADLADLIAYLKTFDTNEPAFQH